MRTFKYKKKIVPVVDGVRCNKCGKEIDIKERKGEGFIRGCRSEIRYGYGSRHDGDVLKFELCDDCADELVASFKLACEVMEEF